MAFILHEVTGEVNICDAICDMDICDACVLFVSSRPGFVFNPNAGAIADHSQSAKDTDPHFKSLF